MAGELADALIARIDKLIADRLDAAVTSRLAAGDYVAPNNGGIADIKSKTDAYLDAAISSDAARVWAANTRTLTSAPSVIKSIQHLSIFLEPNNTSTNVTIVNVNLSKSVLVVHGSSGYGTTNGMFLRVNLVDGYTVNLYRLGADAQYLYTALSIVEFW